MAWKTLVLALCMSATAFAAPMPEIVGGTLKEWTQHRNTTAGHAAVLRYYSFENVQDATSTVPNLGGNKADPLAYQAVPAPNAPTEQFATVPGRFADKSAVHLDQGCYVAKAPALPAKAFTATLWYRNLGQGAHRGNDGTTNGMLMAVGNGYWDGWRLTTSAPSGAVGFEIGRPQPANAVGTNTGPIANGVWHHLAATWDGQKMRVYVDGELSAEREYNGAYTHPADGNIRIGYANSGVGSAMLNVDEVTIYRRALTPEEIFRDLFFYTRISNEQFKLWSTGTEASLAELVKSPGLHQDIAAAARTRLVVQQLRSGSMTQVTAADELVKIVDTLGLPTRFVAQAQMELLSLMKGGVPVRAELYDRFLAAEGASPTDRLMLQLAKGHTRVAAKDYAGASAEYAKVANMESAPPPWRCLALMCMGQASVRAGDYPAARAAYEKAKAIPGEPRYRATEIAERLAEIDRLQAGKPARDPMASRMQVPARPAPGLTLYVAPQANAGGTGTQASPFATLTQARDAIRDLKRKGALPRGGVAVLIRGGRYAATDTFELTADDSGTADAPITYAAATGETPLFDAGATISGFQVVRDPAILSRLPEKARGKVYQTDLKAQGITDPGTFELGGFASGRKAITHPVLELFFDGKAMHFARWPNSGYIHIADVPKDAKGTFTTNEPRIARWKDEKDPWLYGYWFYDWADGYEKVASIDPATKTITLAPPFSAYGDDARGFRAGQRFYGINLLSEIDAPGEYYLDRQSGILYFYPPSDPAKAKIQVSLFSKPAVTMQNVSHVTLQGITWENGQGDGIHLNGGESCLIAGCTIRQFGGNAIVIDGGKDHGILSSDLHTLGRGGTIITGGDRKTLTPGGHYLENNHIHHFSRIDHTYTPAVLMNGVGNRIAHNLMHDSTSSAMRIEGNDHLIEYNDVHTVLLESDDQGGADMWGDPTFRGNIFRYNYWHDMGAGTHVGGAGIRLDDMISGTVIYGNIFARCAAGYFGAVQMNGGKENLIENNLFLECQYAVSGGSRSLVNWRKFLSSDFGKQRVQAFPLNEPPYSTRYPELQQLEENLVNLVWRNVAINCGPLLRESHQMDTADNWTTAANPGLRNPAKGDYAVQKGSALESRLSFAPIPVEQIGLYADSYRKAK